MASEDSDQILPGLAVIHRLRDLSDLDQAAHPEMVSSGDHPQARSELLEIVALRGSKRVRAKEWDDVL
jgi:hypothetical protein